MHAMCIDSEQPAIFARAHLIHRHCDRGSKRFEVGPMLNAQHENGNLPAFQILLIGKALITGDEQIKTRILRELQQFAILSVGPAHMPSSRNFMGGQKFAQRCGSAVIEKNFHAPTSSRRRSGLPDWLAANSSTSLMACGSTGGNHSMNSGMLLPWARWLNSALMGNRVPLKHQTPLMRPASRQTAAQSPQSNSSAFMGALSASDRQTSSTASA